ncbi:MAG: hypothetical protein NC394_03250 [Bacteroides sp.]|nr:hypothetical protein [Bacteroides sp.]
MLFQYNKYLTQPFTLLKMKKHFSAMPYKSRSEIEEDSFRKLKDLCIYSGQHVPYYKNLFKSIGFVPENMNSYEDFKKIPILDKDIVRKHTEELCSDEIKKMNVMPANTSGSTGTPLSFYLDINANMAIFCKLWLMWNQSKKWRIGKTMLSIGAENPELAEKDWWFNPKNRFLYFTSNRMTQDNVEMYYNLAKKYKAAAVCGFPSTIYLFGKLLKEKKFRLEFDTIFVHSENLLDYQEKFIKEFFGARIVNQYGNNEKAGLIHYCKNNVLHSQDDYAYHEVIDERGNDSLPGEIGRLVCTNLFNYCMPLIRYDTRDKVVFSDESCTCGSNFKVVKQIIGRASDVIYTSDNRKLSVIDTAFWDSDNIEMASIYQSVKGEVIVSIVKGKDYCEENEKALIDGFKKQSAGNLKVEIKYVQEKDIPRTPAGKVKFIVSDVKEEL